MIGLIRWISWLVLAALLSGCGKEPLYQEEGYVFGTRVEISLYGEDEARARIAAASVMQEFQRLHNLLHAWQPSPLSELNTALAQGKSHTVTPELADILRDATRLSAQSGELFHPGIGRLIHLWGFQSDEFKPQLPDETQIASLVSAQPSMTNLSFIVSDQGVSVSSRNRAVQIDLGGYAKGYALDRAIVLLKQLGIHNALVNIGGNVMALGQHGSRPWRVGIQHPRKPGPLATLELHDGEAIGTSGDYQRYFELDGQRYCHLIDPRNGRPASGTQAVTLLTHGEHAGVLSDVASKPPFMSGDTGWLAAAERMGVTEVMRIDAAGAVHLSAALQKRLEFADKSQARQIKLR